MYGVVYLIWNMVNGKKYVGQTVKTVKERFKQHAKKKSPIGNAIRKYDKENFRYGVIVTCATKAELDKQEKYFITALNCKTPNGYNRTDGGEGTVGYSPTPEHRAKLAAVNLGKHHAPEHCAKISAAVSGENHPFFGKHHTTQTRAKLAAANLGKHHTTQTRSKMSVSHRFNSPFKNLLSELDKQQLTYSALAKLFGLSVASVSAKITGKVRFTDKEKVKLEEIFCKPADYLLKLEE